MTEELLSEVVGKMNEACFAAQGSYEGKIQFSYATDNVTHEWWIYRHADVCPGGSITTAYSPEALTLCQLVDWCEAWLKGASEMIAVLDKEAQPCGGR